MDQSIFTPLAAEGLTSLKLQYDWRTNTHSLLAAREWNADTNFTEYSKTFTADRLLSTDAVYLGTEQVVDLFEKHGLTEYLSKVQDLLEQGRHEGIEAYFHAEKNIRFMCNQHSRKRGIGNRSHAIMAGGIRRHPREDAEIDVIIDGLNLGRAMSFKNIAAGLNYGGCKTTVQMDELKLDDLEAMGFLAYAIDRCRTMTGPDMYFPTEMADVINEHFSPQITNGPGSPLGESGVPTAYGTFLALIEAVKFKEGVPLQGKSAVVMGLGAVGWYLTEHLLDAGVNVTVSDIDSDKVESFKAKHPTAKINSIPVNEVLTHKADILCPAAIGGIIDETVIASLQYAYVFGPANNQLKATNQKEEERLAQLLADRNILFQTEWWHNTGGVMCGAEEYINGKNASLESLNERVVSTIPRKTRENLEQAHALGLTPTTHAYRVCTDEIYGTATH